MRCALGCALVLCLALQSTKAAQVLKPESKPLDEVVKKAAHTSDFVHQYAIPGWWWCTLFNFRQELEDRDPSLLTLFSNMGNTRIQQANGLAKAYYNNPVLLEHLTHHEKSALETSIIKFFAFEWGILSTRREDMFKLSDEDVSDPSTIPVPLVKKFANLFNIDGNIADDLGGIEAYKVQDKTSALKYVQGLAKKYCVSDPEHTDWTATPRMIPRMKKQCIFPAFLSSLDRYSSASKNCPKDPSYLSDELPFVKHMVAWYKRHRNLQNAFQYHDEIHSMLFATSMPLYLQKYHKSNAVSVNHAMAAAMAGLYHDIGYFLIPLLESEHIGHAASYDDGHELLSFIGALWMYDKDRETTDCPACRRIIAVTILATKIVKREAVPRPAHLDEIQSFLDPKIEDPSMFQADLTKEAVNALPDGEKTRLKVLVRCAQVIYHKFAEGMKKDAVCKPITHLLESMD